MEEAKNTPTDHQNKQKALMEKNKVLKFFYFISIQTQLYGTTIILSYREMSILKKENLKLLPSAIQMPFS